MDILTNRTAIFSIVLLIISFLVGPPISYLFFVILLLISFKKTELFLVVLFSVGTFKNLDIFQHFLVDFTFFTFGIAAYMVLLMVFLKSKINKIGPIGALVLLQGLLMLFSASFISKAGDLKWLEAGRFLIFNLPLFFLPLLIIRNKLQIKNIILAIYFISLLLLGISFHNLYFQKLTSWSLTALGECYIGLSFYMSLGFILLLHCLFYDRLKTPIKTLFFLLLLLFSAGLILAPSRGILISLILVVIILLLKIFISQKASFKRVVFLTLLFLSIMGVWFLTFQTARLAGFGVSRLVPGMVADQSSIEIRMQYFKDSVKDFIENPIIGKGVGMFDYEHGGGGNYPHNIFLEVAAEYGLIGIILFSSFFIYLFCLTLKLIKIIPPKSFILIILFWFLIIFLDSMVSGNITNNRNIWLFGAIILIVARNIKKEEFLLIKTENKRHFYENK